MSIFTAWAQEISADTATAAVEGRALGGVQSEWSMAALFWHADIVVQAVMVLLFLASIYCWVIIFEKWRLMRWLRRRERRFRELLSQRDDWQELYRDLGTPKDPLSVIFTALGKESLRLRQEPNRSRKTDAIRRPLNHITEVTLRRQSDLLERGLGFLATTAAAAPFVGLFGTVWGIMNSFFSIAASNQTSLAVVAPGIAEALFATALGLMAAIPASIAYNKFGSDIARYMSDVENFAYDFSSHLENQAEHDTKETLA